MKPQRIIFLLILLMAAPAGTLRAQLNISGEFRPRLEYRNGYSRLRDSSSIPYATILGRNRLSFDYTTERFGARFTLQHAYVWGENNYGADTITRNTVNLYEGWFTYRFTKGISIRMGRMELVYDDGRLLGNSNWSPRGNFHDAAVVQWAAPKEGYRGDFGFAINNTAPATPYLAPYPLKNYKYMAYLYEQKKFFKDKLTFSVLAFLDVLQKPSATTKKTVTENRTVYVIGPANDTIGTAVVPFTTTVSSTTHYPDQLYGRFTFGGSAGYASGRLKISAAGYYQAGHLSDGRTISAGFAGGYVSYKVADPVILQAGGDYLSGNDYSKTAERATKSNSFSALYPSSHGFYGYMDMFSSHVSSGNTAGLIQGHGRVTVNIGKKVTLEATGRSFLLSKDYLPGAKPDEYRKVDRFLGIESDLMGIYRPAPNFEINVAYCRFFTTETMELLNGLKAGTSEPAHYAYIMLTYRPSFFSTDKP